MLPSSYARKSIAVFENNTIYSISTNSALKPWQRNTVDHTCRSPLAYELKILQVTQLVQDHSKLHQSVERIMLSSYYTVFQKNV